MRRLGVAIFVSLIAFICGAQKAHATSCLSPAQCVSQQSFGGNGTSFTTGSVAYSPNNTAGNTLLIIASMYCSSTTVEEGMLNFADSNGNSWDYDVFTANDDPGATSGVWLGWVMNIKGGANTLTATVASGHTDCSVTVTTFEYAGLYAWNTGNPFVNVSSTPFYGASSSWPLTSALYGGTTAPVSNNLVLGFAVHETGNTGTWTANSGWNSVAQYSGSADTQMAFWDTTFSNAPANLTVGNTGGSSYNNSFVAWLVLNRTAPPPAPPWTVHSCSNGTESITNSCSTTYVSGDTAVVQVSGQNISSWVATPTTTGCTSTWVGPYYGVGSGSGGLAYYYIGTLSGAGGSCTITETMTSAPTEWGQLLIEANVSGLPANYSLDNLGVLPVVGPQTHGCTPPYVTTSDNDLSLTFLSDNTNSDELGPYWSRNWNSEQFAHVFGTSGSGSSGALFSFMNGAAGAQQASFGAGLQFTPSCAVFSFRQSIPPVGYQQGWFQESSSASSLSLPLLWPSTAGDHIFVAAQIASLSDTYTLSISGGPNCIPAPSTFYETGTITIWDCPVSSTAGPLTISMSADGAAQIGMMAWEVGGLAPNNWLVSSTATELDAAGLCPPSGGATTVSSGPLYLYNNDTYYLHSIARGALTSIQPMGSPGFITRLANGQPGSNTLFAALFDQVMTVSGSGPDAVNNVMTGIEDNSGCGAGLWAYDSKPFVNLSQAVQTPLRQSGGGSGTISNEFNEPTNSCTLVETVTSQIAGTAYSISSTPALTWDLIKGGTTSDYYALWTAQSAPSGVVDVTMNNGASAGTVSGLGIKVCNVSGVQAAVAGGPVEGESVGPMTLNTVGTPQYLLACGMSSNDSDGELITIDSPSNWVLKQGSPVQFHEASQNCWDYPSALPGSYTATFNSTAANTMSGFMISLGLPNLVGGHNVEGNAQIKGNNQIR